MGSSLSRPSRAKQDCDYQIDKLSEAKIYKSCDYGTAIHFLGVKTDNAAMVEGI